MTVYRDDAASREARIWELEHEREVLTRKNDQLRKQRWRVNPDGFVYGIGMVTLIFLFAGLAALLVHVVFVGSVRCWYVAQDEYKSSVPWDVSPAPWRVHGSRRGDDLSTGNVFPSQREAWDFLASHTDKVCR